MCRVLGVSVGGPSRPAIAPREHKGQGTRARAQGPGHKGQGRSSPARRHPPGSHAGSGGTYGVLRAHAALRVPGRRGARACGGGPACCGWLLRVAAAGGCCGRAPPKAGTGTRSPPTGSGAPSRRRRPTRACPGPDPGSGRAIRSRPSRGRALRAHGRGLAPPRGDPRSPHPQDRRPGRCARACTAPTAWVALEALDPGSGSGAGHGDRAPAPRAPGPICHTDRGAQHARKPGSE